MINISNMLGNMGKLPSQITDATKSISDGAVKVHQMTTKAYTALKNVPTYNPVSGAVVGGLSKIAGAVDTAAGKAEQATKTLAGVGTTLSGAIDSTAKAAGMIGESVKDLQNSLGVLDSASLVVDAVVNTASGHFHPQANANAFNSFDEKWDSWAKVINSTYEKLSPSAQANVLEKLARNGFGDNVFALGSAIKNESAGVFGGIADFEDALHAFRGSYRNPIEAAKKIESGVKGIVNATERVANSINNMIKTFSKSPGVSGAGNPVLTYLGNLHNSGAVAGLNKILTAGGGAATLLTDTSSVAQAWKLGDLKSMYSSTKKTYEDAKSVVAGVKGSEKAAGITTLAQNNTQTGLPQSSSGQTFTPANTKKEPAPQQNDNNAAGGGDSYVCSGATIRCTQGTSQAKLTVLPDRTVFLTGQPMANISDHISFTNLGAFGRCRSLGFPQTASATAANHGRLTPMPCMHNTPAPWMGGKGDYLVKSQPALLKSSRCQCMWGGTISLVSDGQTDSGKADLDRQTLEEFDTGQIDTEKRSVDDVLDGLQLALDAAGMIPMAGAIPDLTNAAISICRGRWLDAAASLVAAIPGIGDAAGAVKIAKNGAKMAGKLAKDTKVVGAVDEVTKASGKVVTDSQKAATAGERKVGKLTREELAKYRAKRLGVEYDPKNSEILYDSVEPNSFGIETPEIKDTPGNPFSPSNRDNIINKRDQWEIKEQKAMEEVYKESKEKGWNFYTVKEKVSRTNNLETIPSGDVPTKPNALEHELRQISDQNKTGLKVKDAIERPVNKTAGNAYDNNGTENVLGKELDIFI